MNNLYLHTRPTRDPHVFETYWMTGMVAKGKVVATVPVSEDGAIAAELAVAQHLLEECNVCGHDKGGAGLRLFVTFGNIRKLLRADSDKDHLARYAAFLRTRFLGAEVKVENRKIDWVDTNCEARVENIVVAAPKVPLVEVGGFGQVELTAHAIEQYVARFGCKPERAWRHLQAIASEAKPVKPAKRSAFHDLKHRRQGEFAIHHGHALLMVITPPEKAGGHPRMVTIYKPSEKQMVEAGARA